MLRKPAHWLYSVLWTLLIVAAATLAGGQATAKDESAAASGLQVEFDLSKFNETLYAGLAELINDPHHVGTQNCRQSAFTVAKEALFLWDVQTHLRRSLKTTTDAIRDGAKLAGADTVAKVAEIGGEVISAYDSDQPEAALGQALINDSVDWAVDKAGGLKTGEKTVDEQIKDGAKAAGEKAKDKLIDKLFPGKLTKGIDEHVKIPWLTYCNVVVTVDFQPPSEGRRGGVFYQVQGECECPNKNNTSELKFFNINEFLPLEGMDARIEYRDWLKKAIDIKDLLKSSKNFRDGVNKAMQDNPGDEEAPDLTKLAEDVAKKTGKASSIKPVLVLVPHFAKPKDPNVSITCGCDSRTTVRPTEEPSPATVSSETPTPEPPPPTAEEIVQRNCEHICEHERKAFESLRDLATRICIYGKREDCLAAKHDMLEAENAYYECLKKCYLDHHGGALPPWIEKFRTPEPKPATEITPIPTPTPKAQPAMPRKGKIKINLSDDNTGFKTIEPSAGSGATKDEQAYLPPIAGPGSEIVATFVDPLENGPHDVIVATVESDGKHTYRKGRTDGAGRVHFKLPTLENVAEVLLFRHFDGQGNPDHAASCKIAKSAHVSGTLPVPHAPVTGPAITEANSAFDAGAGGQGLVSMHVRDIDPRNARLLLDGNDGGIETLAASDQSVVGKVREGVSTGEHTFSLISAGKRTNAFPADLVTLVADPVPPSEPGTVESVRVHVTGAPSARMVFAVGGAAQLLSGREYEWVPVVNGVAEVKIRGIRDGQAIVRFRLEATIPGFWEASTQ